MRGACRDERAGELTPPPCPSSAAELEDAGILRLLLPRHGAVAIEEAAGRALGTDRGVGDDGVDAFGDGLGALVVFKSVAV